MSEIVGKKGFGLELVLYVATIPIRLLALGALTFPLVVIGFDIIPIFIAILVFAPIPYETADLIFTWFADIFGRGDGVFTDETFMSGIVYVLIALALIDGVLAKFAPGTHSKIVSILTNKRFLLVSYSIGYVGLLISLSVLTDMFPMDAEGYKTFALIAVFFFVVHVVAYYLHRLYFFCMRIIKSLRVLTLQEAKALGIQYPVETEKDV